MKTVKQINYILIEEVTGVNLEKSKLYHNICLKYPPITLVNVERSF